MCINSFDPHDNPTRRTLMFNCSVVSDSLRPRWTVACQPPLSMEFPRQAYWSRLPFPSPGDLPDPGIKPETCLPLHHLRSPHQTHTIIIFTCQIRKLRHWEVRPQGYTTGRHETWHLSLPLTPFLTGSLFQGWLGSRLQETSKLTS